MRDTFQAQHVVTELGKLDDVQVFAMHGMPLPPFGLDWFIELIVLGISATELEAFLRKLDDTGKMADSLRIAEPGVAYADYMEALREKYLELELAREGDFGEPDEDPVSRFT